MNLLKTTRYALKILNYLTVNGNEPLTSIAFHDKLKIPYPYLRSLLTKLSKSGLIKSGQGRGVGYVLAKNPEEIFLIDILAATGEKEQTKECIFGFENCMFAEKCLIHDKWTKANDIIKKILSSTHLGHLKNNKLK
jgi:Rrf2 family iron-sulfur cluster assembly transcriptional regulator